MTVSAAFRTQLRILLRLASAPEAPMSPKKPKRVALYLRVSTSEQTTRNQRRELHAVAERHGWLRPMRTQVSQVPRVVTNVPALIV
jgi:hypothetical protein